VLLRPSPPVRLLAAGPRRSRTARHGLAALALACCFPALALAPVAAARTRHPHPAGHHRGARCPWASPAAAAASSPDQLAAEVVRRMTLREQLAFLVLRARNGYENENTGVPSLCIPPLTLQDGPNGLAFHDVGVTQLPSSLGIAASFDPDLARRYGEVLGAEARGQGIDVVQAPDLNVQRVPESGRAFESYGEDPLLVARMGVAEIEGIQSQGVMAQAKHFAGYTQEIDRVHLDQVISRRALAEVYLPPFRAAVEVAHVASVMCAYGFVNGTNACQDPGLYDVLRGRWGFAGFVRSDLDSVAQPARAFAAGLDLIKRASPGELAGLVASGALRRSTVRDAVEKVLAEMFAYGLISRPRRGWIGRHVDSPAHAAFALAAAERSMVLLKNRGGLLPLDARRLRSLAVIGVDASSQAMTAGFGSANVVAPFRITPLGAIRRNLRRAVTYEPGGSGDRPLPPIPLGDLGPGSSDEPVPDPPIGMTPFGQAAVLAELDASKAAATGSIPQRDLTYLDHWRPTLVVARSGLYTFSITGGGDIWFRIDGRLLYAKPGEQGRSTWAVSVPLVAGRRYALDVAWFPTLAGPPRIGMRFETPAIQAAARAARHAQAAVVFVSDWSSEGVDRPGLSLPGDANALIEAVARANPRTVVVLNTGGAVLMPWLGRVGAVLEAWYPGEEDGAATAAVLFGRFDPAGHLPITFPASRSQGDAASVASWPGVDGVVHFGTRFAIGYRYDELTGQTPLFPFGYGLSYTRFLLSDLAVERAGDSIAASVSVANLGRRAGTAVVQAYLAFPSAAGEPRKLVAFATVPLGPGASRRVTLSVPAGALRCLVDGTWSTVPGRYVVWVGQSSGRLRLSGTVELP